MASELVEVNELLERLRKLPPDQHLDVRVEIEVMAVGGEPLSAKASTASERETTLELIQVVGNRGQHR